MSKLIDAWLAGIVTVAGILISVGSPLVSVTVNAAPLSVLLRVTVAVVAAAPAFSAIEDAAIDTINIS